MSDEMHDGLTIINLEDMVKRAELFKETNRGIDQDIAKLERKRKLFDAEVRYHAIAPSTDTLTTLEQSRNRS